VSDLLVPPGGLGEKAVGVELQFLEPGGAGGGGTGLHLGILRG
jgi:hypothetical protein